MTQQIKILHRYTKAVLYEADVSDLHAAVVKAMSEKIDLSGADLRDADLGGARLGGARLRYADLGGADLRDADLRDADLKGACLRGTYLRRANLSTADLRDADLGGACLRYANLGAADLRDADLGGACLRNADLKGTRLGGTTGISLWRSTPLQIFMDQPGPIRAYKLVRENYEGPYNGGIVYEVGRFYEVPDANTDPRQQCGAGINVATMDWCLAEYRPGYHIMLVEFFAEDIAAIPIGTNGKFRLWRCTVVGEKDLSKCR